MAEEDLKWMLRDDDRDLLRELVSRIAKLAPLACSGLHFIAIGEVWDAIENIIEGGSVEINTELTVGFRSGDSEFKEGLFVSIRVNSDEIVLDELNTTYSREVGSDHFTREYARFTVDGGFDGSGLWDWCNQLEEITSFDDCRLSVSRDHV